MNRNSVRKIIRHSLLTLTVLQSLTLSSVQGSDAEIVSSARTSAETNAASETTTQNLMHPNLVNKLRAAGLITEALYQRQRKVKVTRTVPMSDDAQDLRYRNLSRPVSDREPDGTYVALVIGSNDYTEFETLETAEDDARAIADLLTSAFSFDTELLLNPTRRELISSLTRYRQRLTANDHFLLYYAGHGYLEQSTRRGYWLPVDAEPDNPSNWVSNVEIADAVNSLRANHALVIADSCFAGSLADPAAATGLDATKSAPFSRSRMVITSGGLEPVLDTGFGRHSIFAQALLDQLNAYTDDSTLEGLFEQIRQAVMRHTNQQPQLAAMQFAGHTGGSFRLRRTDPT